MPKLRPLSSPHRPSGRQLHCAFSLLELIIVLVVMIGLMAIVWPNLQKPLSRTSLDEATQMVRTAIDESRYQATLAGTPWFVKLEIGGHAIHAGTFETFMADQTLGSVSEPGEEPNTSRATNRISSNSAMPNRSQIRSWQLPDNVVISDVSWRLMGTTPTSTGVIDSTTDRSNLFGDRSSNELPGSSLPFAQAAPQTAEFNPSSALQDTPVQWLPIVASGRGRDATIVLWDQTAQQSARVVFVSSTGAIEVLR